MTNVSIAFEPYGGVMTVPAVDKPSRVATELLCHQNDDMVMNDFVSVVRSVSRPRSLLSNSCYYCLEPAMPFTFVLLF